MRIRFVRPSISRLGRVMLALAIGLLTFGSVVQPQGAARAVDYVLTSCNVSELTTAYNNAIATTASDTIYLKAGCEYFFLAASASGRALANLPDFIDAGALTIQGNKARIRGLPYENFGLLALNPGALLTIVNTELAYFYSATPGGVISAENDAKLYIENSYVHYNKSDAGGGAFRIGTNSILDVRNTSLTENTAVSGGAIRSVGGTVYVRRSSLITNYATASGGAISLNGGGGTVSNTTISNNYAPNGGGIDLVSGVFTLRNNTIAYNYGDSFNTGAGEGGGIFMSGVFTTPVVMYNTVVARNVDQSPSGSPKTPDIFGALSSSSANNFIGNNAGLSGVAHGTNSNSIGTPGAPLDPRLDLYYNVAGETWALGRLVYHTVFPNSPLINAGSNAYVDDSRDGRLYKRRLYGTTDIGSIEFKRPDSPVVINPANQAWLFRNTNSAGPVDLSFLYGQGLTDYQPVNGDWNGDGVNTQGVYTRFTANNIGVFALSNTFNGFDSGTLPSFVFTDSNGNWLPVAGNWDEIGGDSVGAYNIASGVWSLTNNNSSTTPSYPAFVFGGGAGTIPVAGDWDGNGSESIGIYQQSTGRFILSNGIGSAAAVAYNFVYSGSGYLPVVGDWDGNGTDTPGLYNPSTGQWLLRNSNSSGSADVAFVYGAGSGLIGRAGQWKTVTVGNGTSPIREFAVTPDAPQIAPTFAP